MSKPMIRIVQIDGTVIDREMNDIEFAQYETDQILFAEKRKEAAEATAKRQAALAKLVALGLEEDDLKALGL